MPDPILVVMHDGEEIPVDTLEAILPLDGRRKITRADVASYLSAIEAVSEAQELIGSFYSGRTLGDIVRCVIEHHKDLAVRQLRRTKEFRDDLLTWFRAMAIVLETVSSAATHREKDARLRGAIEVIEGAIGKLRKESFDVRSGSYPFWAFDDVFRSDYPTRELMQRIHDLTDQIDAMRKGSPSTEEVIEP